MKSWIVCWYLTYAGLIAQASTLSKYRQIFFDQVGHQNAYASIWNKRFSLNHVIIRPTKIMNNIIKDCKILTFKVIFDHQKSTESFWIFFSVENIRVGDNFNKWNFLKTLIFKVLYFLKMCPIFVGSVHNFGRSYDDMI